MDKEIDKNWRQLEKLAYQYVKSKYRNEDIIDEELTQHSHDSGFDGTWLLSPKRASVLAQRILMEAKLRNNQSSLSLNDCAKSIIIAFNLAAKKLFIVTNIGFAPQTQIHVNKFRKRSNLLIDCIDGIELKTYIETNWDYLTKKCKLTEDFLSSVVDIAKRLPTRNDLGLAATAEEMSSQLYLLDSKREDAIIQIIQYLNAAKGICMITGNAGVGKSIIKTIVHQDFSGRDFDVCEIDLQLCTSARVLYLNLLETIWGIDISLILKDSELKSYINQLTRTSGGIVEPNIGDAIRHILLVSINQYEEHKDIYLHLLLRYIDMVLRGKKDELKMVISFDNLNMASAEIIAFLLEAVKVLKKNNIKVLMEARTPFLLNDITEYTSSEFYFTQISKCADLVIDLTAFERKDSIKLIQNNLPELGEKVCNSLADVLADNPLEIMSAVILLETLPSFDCGLLNQSCKKALDNYWDESGISRNTVITCLIRTLRNSSRLSEIFELSVIFKGHIPLMILEKLYGERVANVIAEALGSTIYAERNLELVCNHLRFVDAMKLSSNENTCLKLANTILTLFKSEKLDKNKYFLLELTLLYTVKDFESIPEKTIEIAMLLRHNFQFKDALSELLNCLELYKQTSHLRIKNPGLYIKVLIDALICIRELHEENNETYVELYNLLEYALMFFHEKDTRPTFELEYKLILWNKLFTNGDFEESLTVSKELYKTWLRQEIFLNVENDYIGQIYRAYGLTIKMTEGGDAAERIFEKGVSRYPDSFYAKASLLSHQGNILLKTQPLKAAETYLKLLSTVAGKKFSFQEELHTKIDVAMSYFLANEYYKGKAFAEEGIEIASSIGIYMQKGRALNILGCCQTAVGNYGEGIVSFEEAQQCLTQSNATIYLWRAKLNLATILLRDEATVPAAKELLHGVTSILIEKFKNKIENDAASVPYNAILLSLMYFSVLNEELEIQRILNTFCKTQLPNDYAKLKDLPNWKMHFNNKVKYSGSVVLVTG